jgi:hypothetical protein
MKIKYVKRRNAKLKGPLYLYNEHKAGESVAISLGETAEVEDSWGYRIMASHADIVEIVVDAPKVEAKAPAKKKTKKKK